MFVRLEKTATVTHKMLENV